MTNLPSLSLQAVSLHHVSPSRGLKWMLIFSLEKCTILHVLSTSHLSHPSLLIPVYSQLCNVTIFVKQHLKNFPCVIKTTEKTLNYCMCSYLAIACQPRNIHSHETRQSEGEKTTGWCQWQMGWRSWIFFFQGTVSSVSSCKSVPSSIGASVLGGVGQTFHFCKLQGQYTAQYTVSEWGEGTQTKQMWFSIRTNTITDTCLLSSHSSSEFPDLIETRGWKHEWVTSST